MKKVTILLAVLALVIAQSASGSEARHWGICKGALIRAWGACRGDPSGADCCNAVGDAADHCPIYFRWGWLGRANANCEADNTPITRPPPPPPPTPSPPTAPHSPRLSCNVFHVAYDCGTEINEFADGRAPTISAGCCKTLINLYDHCPNHYTMGYDWDKCHGYCVDHQ